MNSLVAPTKVNGGAVRVVALLTTLISLLALGVRSAWLPALLAADFLLRGFGKPRLSPLAAVARSVQRFTPFADTPIFFAPKRFAARIGALLSGGAALLWFLGLGTAGGALLGMLAFFAFLEGAFGYCVGCKIYGRLIRRGIISAENCPDCT